MGVSHISGRAVADWQTAAARLAKAEHEAHQGKVNEGHELPQIVILLKVRGIEVHGPVSLCYQQAQALANQLPVFLCATRLP